MSQIQKKLAILWISTLVIASEIACFMYGQYHVAIILFLVFVVLTLLQFSIKVQP